MTSVLDCVASGGFLRLDESVRPTPASNLLAVATALVHRRRHQGRLFASKRHAVALAPMRPEHHRAPVVEFGGRPGRSRAGEQDQKRARDRRSQHGPVRWRHALPAEQRDGGAPATPVYR
jgi:hypothetical protein